MESIKQQKFFIKHITIPDNNDGGVFFDDYFFLFHRFKHIVLMGVIVCVYTYTPIVYTYLSIYIPTNLLYKTFLLSARLIIQEYITC